MSSQRSLLAIASLAVLGCGPALREPSLRTSSFGELYPAPHAASRALAPGAESGEALSALMEEVGRRRGLSPRATPALVSVPQEALVERALALILHETPEALRAAHAELLIALELVPPDFEWVAALRSALRGRLQAFYAPREQTVFVDRALSGGIRRRALAHELVHALQDQHHALAPRLEHAADAWDQHAALHALAEADAEALVLRLPWPEPDVDAYPYDTALPMGNDTPGVLARSLAAPYDDGRARVEAAYAAGGTAAIDALLQNPPLSTHALLHAGLATPPGGQALLAATLGTPGAPDTPDPWQLAYSDGLGEQTLRIVLEEWLASETAARLAQAWTSDRFVALERGGEHALRWEVELASAEAASAIGSSVWDGLRLPHGATLPPSGVRQSNLRCRAHRDAGVVAVGVRGRRVSLMSLRAESTEAACTSIQRWLARSAETAP